MNITDTQQAILAMITERIDADGVPPSQVEIAHAFGFKGVRSAQYHLEALEQAGAIRRVAGQARGIRLVPSPAADLVPAVQSKEAESLALLQHLNTSAADVAKLKSELTRNWVVPTTIAEEEVKRLSGAAVIYVRLSPEGHVISYVWKKRSDNDQFDDSIERLLKRYQVSFGGQKLPLPDSEEVRAAVLKEGLNLKGWEYTGR